MPSRDAELLAALAADCAGRQKIVGCEAFPESRVEVAEGEVSNILAGRRRMTAAFLREATADPDRTATLTLLAGWAHHRIEPVRRDPFETLDRVATQLDLLLNQASTLKADMDDTREMLAEIRRPKSVRTTDAKGRARA